MSDCQFDNVQTTNQTMRTTQVTCQTLPNQQQKQVLATCPSPQQRALDPNIYNIPESNNIYAITNQIQQRSIDTQNLQYSYLNDDAIVEEYQKLDFPSINNQINSGSYTNKSDFEQTIKRSASPNSFASLSNSQNQQQRIAQLERELTTQKQKYVDLFYNLTNSNDNVKQYVKNMMQQSLEQQQKSEQQQYTENVRGQQEGQFEVQALTEQLYQSNEMNKELLQKLHQALKENEQLKYHMQSQNERLQKQQTLLSGPILRQTQIREEVRKEIEDKLNNKHREEMNMTITKFSREKAMMIKTIELQKLRILDNERIMLQMEGDLDGIREQYDDLVAKFQQKQQKVDKNSYEIPEEQTLNKSDQSDRVVESAKRVPVASSISSIQKLAQQLYSPQSQSNLQQKINAKHHRKNKSFENHNQLQQSKNYLSQQNINNNNGNQGLQQNTSITNLPSSQASSGRNHHQRFSSISTPQSIPTSDFYRVPNQYDFYSPEKPLQLSQKSQKSTSNSKHLSQSQTTNISSKSNSKYLNLSQNLQQTHMKRSSLNNGIQIHEPKVGNHQFQNFVKNSQQYLSPYSLNPNNLNIPQVQFQVTTNLTPLSEQLSYRSSQNNLQQKNNGLISPDHELSEALDIKNQKSSSRKPNSNMMTPSSSHDHSSRVQNISHINPSHLQADNYSIMSSQSNPQTYNADNSINIFNRFKNSVDHINQI